MHPADGGEVWGTIVKQSFKELGERAKAIPESGCGGLGKNASGCRWGDPRAALLSAVKLYLAVKQDLVREAQGANPMPRRGSTA